MNRVELLLFSVFAAISFQDFASAYSTTPLPLNNNCLGCICEAASHCNRTTNCDGDVCGLFRITKAYWIDAGKPVAAAGDDPKSETAYTKCTLDEVCAGTTVSQYVTRFAQDCNEDGKIDCYDYAAIHQRGGYGGCKAQPITGEYLRRYNDCVQHMKQLGASAQF